VKNCYLHYAIEHNYGHHKNVATPLDPASAPKGMSVYEFIPKSIKGQYISAYKINPRFVVISGMASLLFLLVLYKLLGWKALVMHSAAAAGSIMLL
jgi:hypothetical protein